MNSLNDNSVVNDQPNSSSSDIKRKTIINLDKQNKSASSATTQKSFSGGINRKTIFNLDKPKEKESPIQEDFDENAFDLERETERNIAQQTSRMLETVIGLPGDLYNFTKNVLGLTQAKEFLPSSHDIRKFSEKASLGYTAPESQAEEKGGEFISDVAGFLLPGSKKYSLARNIGIPLVANLVQEGVKYAGGNKSATAAKLGTMVFLDLLSHRGKGPKPYVSKLFEQSESLVPKGATLTSANLQSKLPILRKQLESGGKATSTTKAIEKLSEIEKKIENGKIEVQELLDFRKKINEAISEYGGYQIEVPKNVRKSAIRNLNEVKDTVISAINEYGQKVNPEFGKINKAANEAYAAYQSSNTISNFVKKTLKTKHPGVKALFYGAATGTTALTAKTAALVGPPLYMAHEVYKILHQVTASPTLRKFYVGILEGAAAGNASQVTRNAKALEKHLPKEDQSK